MNASDVSHFFDDPAHEGKIRFAVIDRSGDTRFTWDPQVQAEVDAARALFELYTNPPSKGGKGYAAFRIEGGPADGPGGAKGEQVRSFDPSHRRLLFAPPMVGG